MRRRLFCSFLVPATIVFLLSSTATMAQQNGVLTGNYLLLLLDETQPEQTAPAPVARTGQTACWDTAGIPVACPGTGQDGDKQAGVAWPNPRFEDNGDGTVTDNLTCLIWLKDSDCFANMNWEPALAAANGLAQGECGLTDNSQPGDWRLPNIRELYSLIDFMAKSPALPGGFFNYNSGQIMFWTSSNNTLPEKFRALAININDGRMDWRNKSGFMGSGEATMRPVRSGSCPQTTVPASLPRTGQTDCWDADGTQAPCAGTGQDGDKQAGTAWPNPRFTNNNNGTVTDNLTGIVWLQDAGCFSPGDWQSALDDANGLGHGACGLSDNSQQGDWRLPNILELMSIIDHGRSNPALPDQQPFMGIKNSYWTSSTYFPQLTDAWRVDLDYGFAWVQSKSDTTDGDTYVWPIRGGKL